MSNIFVFTSTSFSLSSLNEIPCTFHVAKLRSLLHIFDCIQAWVNMIIIFPFNSFKKRILSSGMCCSLIECNYLFLLKLLFLFIHWYNFYFLIYEYERIVWWWKKSVTRFLWLYMFPACLNMQMWFLECCLCVCMYVYVTICSLLAPEQLDILFIFSTGTYVLVWKMQFHFNAPY
jgi:hypothetical protein